MIMRFKNRNPLAFRLSVSISIWILASVVLLLIFNAIDFVDFLSSERSAPYQSIDTALGKSFERTIYPRYVPRTWAIVTSLCVVVIGFNIVGADIMYRHAKRCSRSKTVWCVATAFFSLILTGIVYLLTRPESQEQ